MTTVPIAEACGQLKVVSDDAMELQTARDLGVFIDRWPGALSHHDVDL
jgi:hypothetical protein